MADYTASRATAERLIQKFGGAAFLVTQGHIGGTAFNPGTELEVEAGIFAAVVEYTVQERSADGIQVGDRRAIISAGEGVDAPGTSTLLRFKDEQDNPTDFTIVRVSPLQPGGPNDVAIFYDCQVRG
jgi:hypothetical protein